MVAAVERRVAPPFRAGPKQAECARHWFDPGCRVLLAGGAVRSGKTQGVGRLLVETAIEQPATYLVARLTYRELKDSTQKAMLYGDGSLPPLIPPEAVEQYRASDELVRLRTGGEILFRSLDEPAKLLNLTLGGVFIDQVEELDPGPAGERIFDTLLGRLSDPRGPRKLVAVANPTSTMHWCYRRIADEATRDGGCRYVHFSMRDNARFLPADYVAAMEATRTSRPYWYRSFVLGEWGAFEGAAFTEFDPAVHVVSPFRLPDSWERFESMDHGANNPTAWYLWAADYDGNLLVVDEYYSPGLVSRHAPEILGRRAGGRWQLAGHTNVCWADPSVSQQHGLSRPLGGPASILTEYADYGIGLSLANHDRAAGYLRLLELLHVEEGRVPPGWADVPGDVGGSPRLFVSPRCRHLVEQLKGAPLEEDGLLAGEAVAAGWEREHGHACAALRYGAMSRPSPSERPGPVDDDPRVAALRLQYERERERESWETEAYSYA
jgi:hypothetical protein